MLITLCISAWAEEESEKPYNILIIHAYHLNYDWTYNQNQGISNVIKETYPDANIYTEFLDWKRFPDEQVIEDYYNLLKEKYKDTKVDIIFTTDDKGLEFALNYREEIFNNAPIAFSGIIGSTAKEIIGDHKNVTGVYETMKPEGAIELMRLLQPELKTIYVVHDISESGLRTSDTFYDSLDKMGLSEKYTVIDWHDKTFDEIYQAIQNVDKNSAVMLISYNISSDGLVLQPEVFCNELSQVSSVPIYSIDEFLFGEGIVGGTFLSGILQGEEVGRLGVQILDGKNPDDIPHIAEATVYTGVDEDILMKYDLDKNVLTDDTVIINEHFSFFETYKELVLITGTIIIALVIFAMILMRLLAIIKRSRDRIAQQNIALQELNDQLQISEEELVAQNEELVSYQEDLKYEAQHDYLTKLPNRILLKSYMNNKIESVWKDAIKIVVVFIDLDNFKFINNTYGHSFGDEVLIKISARLKELMKDVFVARIGGDEFVLIKTFKDIEQTDEINHLMLFITQAISQKIVIAEETVRLSASIGYSICPEDGDNFEDLIVEADMAMYLAKKEGKANQKRYKNHMSDELKNEYILVGSLKEAYDNHEFTLNYQPIMKADGSEIVGFESLIRWQSSTHGYVPPTEFIPLAESSGLIIPIGYYIIETAVKFAKKLIAILKYDFKVSINISVIQFYEDDFAERLLSIIQSEGIDTKYIKIEITESVMINTYDAIIEKLKFLREKGLSISLDDFGTGYSSLSYLHELPIDELKIDKIFVDDINELTIKSPLIDATITLAKSFGLTTVAEGVELKEQVAYLESKGCDLIQGYYFSKPMLELDALGFCDQFQKKKL